MENLKKMLTISFILVCFLIVGCGKEEKPEEDKVATPKEEKVSETVGNESEDALQMSLTNRTGLEIVGISVRSSWETEYPVNMLRSGQSIRPDEKVMFYYTMNMTGENEAALEQSEGSGILAGAAMNLTHSLQVTYVDGTIKEATLFPVEEMEEVVLHYEEGLLYLTYKSKEDGSEVSTKEAEAVAAYNKMLATSVVEQIQQLGETTLENEEAIKAAKAAYDALPEEIKPQVFNAQELIEKELMLEELKQQAAQQWEAEQREAAQRAEAEQWTAQQQAAQQTQGTGMSDDDSQDYGDVSQRTDDCLGDVLINDYQD